MAVLSLNLKGGEQMKTRKLVQFKIDSELLAQFDAILKNRTRSQAIRDFMERSVEQKKVKI